MKAVGYLLIADISGYTDFVRLHALRKQSVVSKFAADFYESHAEIIVSELLEAVIEAVEPSMNLNKLEGDAAFFYSDDEPDINQADKILTVMQAAQIAFQKKAQELLFVEACGCEPCTQAKNLRLKIVVHRGEYIHKKIRNFDELAGEAVIFVHRMLKNNVKSDEYWLVSKEVSRLIPALDALGFCEITENLDNFGQTKLDLKLLNSKQPKNDEKPNRSQITKWLKQALYFSKATIRRKFASASR